MPDEEVSTFIGQIPVVADKFRGVAKDVFGIELDYSAASIAKLDRLIQDGWPDGPPTMLDNMVLNIGSYLGEAIRCAVTCPQQYLQFSGLSDYLSPIAPC